MAVSLKKHVDIEHRTFMRLGRLDEAQGVIESCLLVFKQDDAVADQARALGALANVWDERGDLDRAIALERHSLSLCSRLAAPSDRAASHNNLANYLEKAGRIEESAWHVLAAGIYFLVSGHGQELSLWLGNLRVGMRRAASSGGLYQLAGVSDVVSRPEFEALRRFLEGWELEGRELEGRQVEIAQLQADIVQLQAGIDHLAALARGEG